MRFLLILIAALVLSSPAMAQDDGPIAIDVADRQVDITTGFDGSSLVVYGVTREEGDIAVLITGPQRTMVARRKSNVGGAWVNTEWIEFDQVPAFYDYALSRFAMEEESAAVLHENGIGLNGLDFLPRGDEKPENVAQFREALIRNKQTQGLFPLKARGMEFVRGDFFKTQFSLPSNVPTGDYTVQAFLFRGGKIRAQDTATFRVAQVGFSARIYSFAYRDSLAYGLVAVAMAFFAGWAAFTFLRRD